MKTNLPYYGDNLDILRRYIPDESVDLVYLDPPFNSNRDYNVIFRDGSGRQSDAQLLGVWGNVAQGGGDACDSYGVPDQHPRGMVPDAVDNGRDARSY